MGPKAQVKWFTEDHIPDLSGKVILVTGGNRGLGKEVVLAIAKRNPQHIFLTVRNLENSQAAVEDIKTSAPGAKITLLQCDLSSLATVRKAAEEFRSQASRLDIVICSAGVMIVPPSLSQDGYEIQFATNHLGHALLVKLVLPVLLHTAQQLGSDVRFVVFTSQGYMMHPSGGILFDQLRTKQENLWLARYQLYGQSKLANVLYAAQLAERYPQITAVSVHPGVVETELMTGQSLPDRIFLQLTTIGKKITPKEGAKNAIWAATTDKASIKNGSYYEPVGILKDVQRWAKDHDLARRLWEWTETELEPYIIQDKWS
ncbi:putative oxidoreductase C736,13 [Talaromyces islandicus]|uniref:Putative oxidoreductase C736,13 n=1 Tax=Talaromyces islandicus TaxID=28573 RepID=A0A0U1M7U7_TALIS|nr:putative oxidoreductase C736,13 [Talaromyces islandicus]